MQGDVDDARPLQGGSDVLDNFDILKCVLRFIIPRKCFRMLAAF